MKMNKWRKYGTLLVALTFVTGLSGLAAVASDDCFTGDTKGQNSVVLAPADSCASFNDLLNQKGEIKGTTRFPGGDCDGEPTNC